MISYKIFNEKDISQLVSLWKTSFGEGQEAIGLFFDNLFKASVCLTACDGEKIVSSLYLLPCGISGEGYDLNGYYLYAASTLPSYRNRGIMRNLINTATCFAEQSRKDFISLLPAKGDLYEFYKTNGFKTCFGTVDMSVNLNRVTEYSYLEMNSHISDCNFTSLVNLRESHYSTFPHIKFDELHLKYSVVYNEYYGAKFVSLTDGYALYFENKTQPSGETEVFISEIVCPSDKLREYLSFILKSTNCKKMTVRLNSNCAFNNENLFLYSGERKRFAMIKPLNEVVDFDALRKNIYLGLTLE